MLRPGFNRIAAIAAVGFVAVSVAGCGVNNIPTYEQSADLPDLLRSHGISDDTGTGAADRLLFATSVRRIRSELRTP
jgi:hypothetical protein